MSEFAGPTTEIDSYRSYTVTIQFPNTPTRKNPVRSVSDEMETLGDIGRSRDWNAQVELKSVVTCPREFPKLHSEQTARGTIGLASVVCKLR